jgi:acetolactate synthase-1/2/3 large subunit
MNLFSSVAELGTSVCWGTSSEYEVVARDAGLRFIRVCSGMTAGFAADASAQLSGAPGLVAACDNLGALSVVPGIAHARVNRAPLVAVRPRLHDLRPLLTASAKGVYHAFEAPKAVRLALSPHPGPVWVEQPPDALPDTELEEDPTEEQTALPAALLDRVRRWRKPAIVVGFAGRRAPIADLAARLRAPVFTTVRAKGALPEADGWSAGAVGLSRLDQAHQRFLTDCDGVLLVGWDADELPDAWSPPWTAGADRVAISSLAAPDVDGWVGHLAAGVARLTADLDDSGSTWSEAMVAAHRAVAAAALLEPGFGPATLALAVRSALRGGDVCAIDGVSATFAHGWRADRPDRLLTGHARLPCGYALPAALAAAAHGRRVVCVTNRVDRSEFTTAAENELPLVVVAIGADDGISEADEVTAAIAEALLIGGIEVIRVRGS